MTLLYTPVQTQNAQTIWSFWISKGCSPNQAAAWVGNVDGECSLIIGLIGDNNEAHGISQWHDDRIEEILEGTGIDIRSATLPDQLEAAYWECTEGWYKDVWPKLLATKDIQSAVTVLVQYYEQSGSQARDVARRTTLATYWYSQLSTKASAKLPLKKSAFKPLTTHIDHAGRFPVMQIECPHATKKVKLKSPRSGILHTTEGGWSGSMGVFHRHYAPHFILGVDQEDHNKVHIAQLVPIGYIGSACRDHNDLAIVQIEVIGFSKETAWRPDDSTCEALAELMVVCEREWGIPLTHPWPDGDYGRAGDNPHRHAGKLGHVAGWFAHGDMPPPDEHWDVGNLEWSYIFKLANQIKAKA